jgi:hypothetical protein
LYAAIEPHDPISPTPAPATLLPLPLNRAPINMLTVTLRNAVVTI